MTEIERTKELMGICEKLTRENNLLEIKVMKLKKENMDLKQDIDDLESEVSSLEREISESGRIDEY